MTDLNFVRFVHEIAELACLLEASAEKPGNVTPTRCFHDMRYEDFVRSAIAIGPEMVLAGTRGIGETVLAATRATRRWVRPNTNLGIVLLLAPLARAMLLPLPALGVADLRTRVGHVLRELTVADARAAYEAIRSAVPGGMSDSVDGQDVRTDVPTITLREAMALAAQRDSIASEYMTDYAIVFERGLPAFKIALAAGLPENEAIIQTYLHILADVPDTLIARKNGLQMARQVSAQAANVMAQGGMLSKRGRRATRRFDAALRTPRNQLNPGTTADLIAATLFVALLEGVVGQYAAM